MKRGFILVVLCLCAVLSLLPEEVSAADSASEREEKLYQLLLEGIRDKKGLDGESYIDISELGIFNEDGNPDRDMLWTVFCLLYTSDAADD